jgi:repressor LexA
MEVGSKIRFLRKYQNLTLQELADRANISLSYLGDIEKGRSNPSISTFISIARALETPPSYFLDENNSTTIDIIDFIVNSNRVPLTAGGQPLTQDQRLSILRVLDKPGSNHGQAERIPILGNIRAGIPLLSEQNRIGEIDIAADLIGKADFALIVSGDSMIGAGINDGDIALCKQGGDALHGQIVVALVNNDETTLKFYIRENGKVLLRSANPLFKDIELKPGDKIQGHAVRFQKETPSVNLYREFLYFKENHLQEWNTVIESAVQHGITPQQISEMIEMHWQMVKRLAEKTAE